MEDEFRLIFGSEGHVLLIQECARACLIFFYGLLLLRLSGKRTFGKLSAIDAVLSIIVGSALARTMTGSAPLPGTMAAAAVLVGRHVAISSAVARWRTFGHFIEGRHVILAEAGVVDEPKRIANMISEADLCEALRQKGVDGMRDLTAVKKITLEPGGTISVIRT